MTTPDWRKSARCRNESDCIEIAWRAACRNEGNCVQIGDAGTIRIRDSADPDGPHITLGRQAFTRMITTMITTIKEL